MKDTLLYLVQQIVSQPQEARVEEQSNENGKMLVIHVHPDDMGKIIGKSGRIIRALRDITKLIATKHNEYVDVLVDEQPAGESVE